MTLDEASRQWLDFSHRLAERAKELRAEAEALPAGKAVDAIRCNALLTTAFALEVAATEASKTAGAIERGDA